MTRRVLVCGGRDYGYIPRGVPWGSLARIHARIRANKEREQLKATLDARREDIGLLIHGAARGADELADAWAKACGVLVLPFKADWYPNGRQGGMDRSAGPKRNQRMMTEGKPDLVIAFPGGKGTANMIDQARLAGVEIIEVESVRV